MIYKRGLVRANFPLKKRDNEIVYLCPKDNVRVFAEQCEKCMLKNDCKAKALTV